MKLFDSVKEERKAEVVLADMRCVSLSEAEKALVWSRISERLASGWTAEDGDGRKRSILSLLLFNFPFGRRIATVAVFAAVVTATSGVVYAANNARPGDAMFSFDRGMEWARLALTRSERAQTLKIAYAGERLREVESLLEEEAARMHAVNEEFSDDVKVRVRVGIELAAELLGSAAHYSDTIKSRDDFDSMVARLKAKMDSASDYVVVTLEDDELFVGINGKQVASTTLSNDEGFEFKNDDDYVRIKVDKKGDVEVKTSVGSSGGKGTNGGDGEDGRPGEPGKNGKKGTSSVSISTTIISNGSSSVSFTGKTEKEKNLKANSDAWGLTADTLRSLNVARDTASGIMKRFLSPEEGKSGTGQKDPSASDAGGWTLGEKRKSPDVDAKKTQTKDVTNENGDS